MSSRNEKIRDFIREVAEDFNVEPPEIVVSSEQTEKECRPEACGCYNHKAGRILLREARAQKKISAAEANEAITTFDEYRTEKEKEAFRKMEEKCGCKWVWRP